MRLAKFSGVYYSHTPVNGSPGRGSALFPDPSVRLDFASKMSEVSVGNTQDRDVKFSFPEIQTSFIIFESEFKFVLFNFYRH